jgi:threonine aldolase
MKIIDLRSDTVTLPTPEMRKAMAEAELGDDVFGEDPTVNRLEELAAHRLGKEAALFVPSGTMANLASVLTHCARGEEAILGDRSHIFLNEAGGIAALGGIHPHTLPNLPDGTIDITGIEAAVRGENVHWPRSGLICLETTHNRCCGSALPIDYLDEVSDLADEQGLPVHIDGARIFNASVALGCEAREIAGHADTVSFCLSKGLCAPVGSLICGTEDFIFEARRNRKLLGGGMRQAGVLAAAGIVALKTMVERLEEDHSNAERLREGLSEVPGMKLYEGAGVLTNILYVDLTRGGNMVKEEGFMKGLEEAGVKMLRTDPYRFRLVTHHGITAEDIDDVVETFGNVLN